MIKERFFPFFLFCSILIHVVLSVYFILEPFSGVFAKKHIPITQAVRISSIDSSALQIGQKKEDKALPLKKTADTPSTPVAPKDLSVPKKKAQKKAQKQTKPKKSPQKKEQKKRENQTLKNIQQKQSQALDKLSALDSIEKIKQELVAEQNKETPSLTENSSPVSGPTADFQTLQYFTTLKAHINMYWNLPQELAGQNLRTQVYAEIDRLGQVLKGEILKSSGNEDFDARVLETINRASPFPPPPTKKIEKLLSKGVVFNFPK